MSHSKSYSFAFQFGLLVKCATLHFLFLDHFDGSKYIARNEYIFMKICYTIFTWQHIHAQFTFILNELNRFCGVRCLFSLHFFFATLHFVPYFWLCLLGVWHLKIQQNILSISLIKLNRNAANGRIELNRFDECGRQWKMDWETVDWDAIEFKLLLKSSGKSGEKNISIFGFEINFLFLQNHKLYRMRI